MAPTGPPRCCESDFGLDPTLVQQSCGFSRYLGESEELACVHRFADEEGVEHELRVTPLIGTSLDSLARSHRGGGAQAPAAALAAHFTGSDETGGALASTAERHWVAFGSSPVFHRLSWAEASCPAERMLPVFAAMAAASVEPPLDPLPRLEFEGGSVVPEPESLLGAALERPGPSSPAERPALPLGAEKLGHALLHSAASEALETFVDQFGSEARWGLPDRRQLSARALAEDPRAAMHALRVAAARLPAEARLHCPKPDRRNVAALARGEATMWCLWTDASQLDMIVLGLRDARVTYLGVFPHAPLAPVAVPGEPPPPPAISVPAIVCGDPHALDYPGLCPEDSHYEDEDEDEEADVHGDPASLEAELEQADQDEREPSPAAHIGETVQVVPAN